jgi:hypothetical protein
MMDSFSELRACQVTTSTDPAVAEFLRLEYPGETRAWLLRAADSPTPPATPPSPSGPRRFWTRILARLRRGREPHVAGAAP